MINATVERETRVDFSWVKLLAEEANDLELKRQENERKRIERETAIADATTPFVEKLFMLLNMCTEEFNKHCMFPNLRVTMTRFHAKVKPSSDPAEVPEHISYFTFTRRNWLYGIRGVNGKVDFVQFPVTEGAGGLNLRLDELGIDGVYRLQAQLDEATNEVTWTLNEIVLDGPRLIQLCQNFFSEFVHATNTGDE